MMSVPLWKRIALEDIEVYRQHKLSIENWIARIEEAIAKEKRRPTAAEVDRIAALRKSVVEYEEDMSALERKLDPPHNDVIRHDGKVYISHQGWIVEARR